MIVRLGLLKVVSMIQSRILRRDLESKRDSLFTSGCYWMVYHVLPANIEPTPLNIWEFRSSLFEHIYLITVQLHRVSCWSISLVTLLQVIIWWNGLETSQGVSKSLSVLTCALCLVGQSTTCNFDIGVPSRAIALILDRFGMDVWLLVHFIFFLMI